jgi:hypothetical protein
MPMAFPDFKSLCQRAEQRNFRKPNEGETEEEFRQAFAESMQDADPVEAHEIRSGKGWDEWDGNGEHEFLVNMMGAEELGKLIRSITSGRKGDTSDA